MQKRVPKQYEQLTYLANYQVHLVHQNQLYRCLAIVDAIAWICLGWL